MTGTPAPATDQRGEVRRIARPIGRADLAHYESLLVHRLALAMAGTTETGWAALPARSRNRWNTRALDVLAKLLGDADVVDRLLTLMPNLKDRR